MAFDYAKFHSRSFYNSKGQPYACHSIDDENRAKEQGFTSSAYIRSRWPTTVYNKQTGESKTVGNLDWPDEKNAAAIAGLGPDWTTDYVAPVAPKSEAAPAEGSGSLSLMALAEVLGEVRAVAASVKQLSESMIDIETSVADLTSARVAMESRMAEMESVFVEPVLAGPTIEQAEKKKK